MYMNPKIKSLMLEAVFFATFVEKIIKQESLYTMGLSVFLLAVCTVAIVHFIFSMFKNTKVSERICTFISHALVTIVVSCFDQSAPTSHIFLTALVIATVCALGEADDSDTFVWKTLAGGFGAAILKQPWQMGAAIGFFWTPGLVAILPKLQDIIG